MMDVKLIAFVLSFVYLADALVRVPVRVHHLKKEFNPLNDFSNSTVSPEKDTALVISLIVNGKPYSVALEATSQPLWLPSEDCTSSHCLKVENKIKLDSRDTPKSIHNGKVQGYEILSNVEVGGYQRDVKILAADTIESEVAKKLPPGVDGSMGLLNTEIFHKLLDTEGVISLHINKRKLDKSALYLGVTHPKELTKRGLDLNQLTFTTISDDGIFSLNYISNTNGPWVSWSIGGADIAIDLEVSGLHGPAEEVNSINKYIGTDDNGYIDCTNIPFLPSLTLHIEGTSLILHPKEYITTGKYNLDVRCQSIVPHYLSRNIWILGSLFHTKYLTVFKMVDSKVQVAFAELK